MKVKVLNYFIINKLKPNQKNILDIKILSEEQGILNNKRFVNKDKGISFIIKSVGHINPAVEDYYPVVVEIDQNNELENYKDLIFYDNL